MDTEGIAGVWRPIRAERDGETAPEMALEPMRLVFQDGAYAFRFGEVNSDEGTFTWETAADYFVLTLRGIQGVNAGRTIPGLAQLRGDRLRVCFGLDGSVPTHFQTSRESARYLVTYRRE
jgi:uncharacterized protein (TIGR03067 family)